jgi:hypothetical protein
VLITIWKKLSGASNQQLRKGCNTPEEIDTAMELYLDKLLCMMYRWKIATQGLKHQNPIKI